MCLRAGGGDIDEFTGTCPQPGRRSGVQYDEIYQCRRVTASASDTEKQSPTLDKYSDATRVDRVLSALAVQKVRSV